MDPPHIVLPLYNMSICQGHDPLFAFLPAMTLLCATSGLPQDPLGFKITSKDLIFYLSFVRFFMAFFNQNDKRMLFYNIFKVP